jgi:hypothetical protein
LALDFPIKYKCNKKLIDNKNPKSNFEKGLSILIQSVILDCNPDRPIHQSNPSTPCIMLKGSCKYNVMQ